MFKEDELFLVSFCFGEPIVCLQPHLLLWLDLSLDAFFIKKKTKRKEEQNKKPHTTREHKGTRSTSILEFL